MRSGVSASITPPVMCIEASIPDSFSISSYSVIVYCWSLATLGSPLSVCMPPAECQVEPAVYSARSRSTTSVQPSLVRWYRTEAPTTPPPMTTTWVFVFMTLPSHGFLEPHRSMVGGAGLGPVPRRAASEPSSPGGTVKPASESLVMQSASMLWNRCSGSSKRGASGPG